MDFIDIDKNLPNGANMGGLPQCVYFAKHSDVATWPTEPSATGVSATLETMGSLVGDVEMVSGKTFKKFYITDDEGKVDFESVGELDGKSFEVKLRIYNPGLQAKLLGFINLAKNDNLAFIVPDNNGGHFLLGDSLRAAVLSGMENVTTGQKTSDRPGAGLIFSYKTANLYRYAGTIPLTDDSENVGA